MVNWKFSRVATQSVFCNSWMRTLGASGPTPVIGGMQIYVRTVTGEPVVLQMGTAMHAADSNGTSSGLQVMSSVIGVWGKAMILQLVSECNG
jgi:hypothetical protein